MIREYVEGHKWNGTKDTVYGKRKYVIARFVIRVDGELQGFIAWGDTSKEAKMLVKTFSRTNCICRYPENRLGETPPCPVHRNWRKLMERTQR